MEPEAENTRMLNTPRAIILSGPDRSEGKSKDLLFSPREQQ